MNVDNSILIRPMRSLLLAVCCIVLFTGVAIAVSPLGNVTVTNNGITYDHGTNETSISYDVSVSSPPALSHVVFGICEDIVPNGTEEGLQNQENPLPGGVGTWLVAPHGSANVCEGNAIRAEVGDDPTTGVRGIKFECVGAFEFLEPGDSATFEYTVDGIWAEDSSIEVGAKAGPNQGAAVVGGLDCDSVNLQTQMECADFNSPDPFYRITTENGNPNDATNVEAIVELPEDVAFDYANSTGVAGSVSCTGDGANPETVTCELTQLAEETWTLDIYVIDNTGTPTEVTASVEITSDEVEAYAQDNEAECTTTTPVSLALVNSHRTDMGVQFNWTTTTEVGNIGFEIVPEGQKASGPFVESTVGDSIVPQHYSYFYEGFKGDTFYLVDYDVMGNLEWHGPFQVGDVAGSFEEPVAIDWNEINTQVENRSVELRSAERLHAVETVSKIHQSDFLDNADFRIDGSLPFSGTSDKQEMYPTYRLEVTETGVHRITYQELADAGLDLQGVSASHIALTVGSDHSPVPIRVTGGTVFGPYSTIEFYGEAIDTIYTGTNVYHVQVNPALARRMNQISPYQWTDDKKVMPFYFETIRRERQARYSVAPPLGKDPWYDLRMLVYRSERSWNIPLHANDWVGGDAALSVDMWGVTNWPGNNDDHHVIVEFNGHQIQDLWNDGRVDMSFTTNIPEELMRTENTLTIRMPGDTGYQFDLVNLDHADLTYRREFVVQDDQLMFHSTEDQKFSVSGFSTGQITAFARVGDDVYHLPVQVTKSTQGYSGSFIGIGQEAEYVVVAEPAVHVPVIQPPRLTELPQQDADILLITHELFIDTPELDDLQGHWAQNGLSIVVAEVNDIYAEYSGGVKDARAIQLYIADMVSNHQVQYVQLVGGDVYDYRDRLGRSALSFVPTLYTHTDVLITHTASDALMADVDGDDFPDVPIARFPAQSVSQLAAMVEKTLQYASRSTCTVVAAADRHDGRFSYTRESEKTLAMLGPGCTVTHRAYLDNSGSVAEQRQQLIQSMNEGPSLVSFTGHSGLSAWTFDGLFRNSHISQLTNEEPTLVVQWGCWNTYFVAINQNVMSHKFMVSDSGAAVVLGPSTLTDVTHERAYADHLMPLLGQEDILIGEAVQAAKERLFAKNPHMRDVSLGFHIMGDVATQVPLR